MESKNKRSNDDFIVTENVETDDLDDMDDLEIECLLPRSDKLKVGDGYFIGLDKTDKK